MLVSPRGWPDGATEQRPPDWAWRLELVHDVRTDDPERRRRSARDRSPRLRPRRSIRRSPLDGYAQAVARHASAAAENVQLRTIVAEFNVGAVRFRRDGDDGPLIARGELYSRNYKRMAAPPTAEINTLHEVPLVPTAEPRPTLGG